MLHDAKPSVEPGVIGHGCWRLRIAQLRLLTPREFEVFLLLAAGWSYREMAARLNVRDRTIRAHLAAILPKLELGSVVHARLASYGYSISCDAMAEIGEPDTRADTTFTHLPDRPERASSNRHIQDLDHPLRAMDM
ncbi:helix-turn-helix transcriptional regulator [Nonomuraea sp. NPDC003709]|uniref:response regulator transcription factor n=1 Tax=Nonomuraea sp. NPDC003709 TaxID=3154450 RepID=UPI0033BB99B5